MNVRGSMTIWRSRLAGPQDVVEHPSGLFLGVCRRAVSVPVLPRFIGSVG